MASGSSRHSSLPRRAARRLKAVAGTETRGAATVTAASWPKEGRMSAGSRARTIVLARGACGEGMCDEPHAHALICHTTGCADEASPPTTVNAEGKGALDDHDTSTEADP